MRNAEWSGELVVFAQRTDARIELEAWQRHATQFFGARVGLTEEKPYPAASVSERFDHEEATVVIAPDVEAPGMRRVIGRAREDGDLEAAEVADAHAGSTGLALLARRCGYVWLVESEGDDDRLALRLAAVIASVVLGPILSRDRQKLFGVRTARALLSSS